MEEIDIKIKDVFVILKIKWKIIIVIAIAVASFVAVMSIFVIKPVYEVNTKVFIGKEETKDTKYDNNDIAMYQKLLKTYSELIKTNDLIENAINEKNLDITPAEVFGGLEITPRTDTQILQISYKNKDNILAKEILVAVVDEFIKESKQLIPNGMVKVIESVELPQYPISPNKEKNVAIACLAGLMLGSGIVLLMEYMDDTFKTKEQIEKIMEIAVIGMIPLEDKNSIRCNDKHVKKTIRD